VPPVATDATEPDGPDWIAQPRALGAAPAFPSVYADARDTLVAPEGLIWLGETDATGQPASLDDRLGRLLACLSQLMPLPEHVTVWSLRGETAALVALTLPQTAIDSPARFYDAAGSAAFLNGGVLYIGADGAFIQYRDGHAPCGYDAEDVEPAPDHLLYLVGPEGTWQIARRSLVELPLSDVLLRLTPLPSREHALPTRAFALIATPLYRLLARYLRAHRVRYRLASFLTSQGENRMLFELTPAPDTPDGAPIPAFVLAYLTSLPHCVTLTEVATEAGRRLLVAWGQHYPCLPQHILTAFPEESLVLYTADAQCANLCLTPAPPFFDGDALLAVQTPPTPQRNFAPMTSHGTPPVTLPMRMVPASGPLPPTAALLLDPTELGWIRRLFYRLPREAFASYILCLGQQNAVLLGEDITLTALPFGTPMRRIQDTPLFLSLRARLTPELPWAVLAQVLNVTDTHYTFLTQEYRFTVPCAAFLPLSHALAAPDCPHLTFEVLPVPALPTLEWTPPPQLEIPAEASRPRRRATRQATLPTQPTAPQGDGPTSMDGLLRAQAETYVQNGDALSAAMCFTLAGDALRAARCYEEAAQQLSLED
jgi:hypothetical protein